jgi:Predicted nucleotide-binding protein containing TIR-like domain
MRVEKYYDTTTFAPVVLRAVIETLFPPLAAVKCEASVWNTQRAVGFDGLEDFMRAVGTGEILGFDLVCESAPPPMEAASTTLEDFMTAISIEVFGDPPSPHLKAIVSIDDFSKDLQAYKIDMIAGIIFYYLNKKHQYGYMNLPGSSQERKKFNSVDESGGRATLDGLLIALKSLEMSSRQAADLNVNKLLSRLDRKPERGLHVRTTHDDKVCAAIWCDDASDNEEILNRAFGFLDSYAKVAPFTKYPARSIETLVTPSLTQGKVELARVEQQPRVFIGHGHDPAWRDLKDHLQDKHGIKVIAYESGERGGHAIRDILEELMSSASLAFLVLTKEDETLDGASRARQNVVHEVGLFQGRLGFTRAIVISQEGTEVFSNIAGVHQLHFRNKIQEVFGDALAVYRREFGFA